MRSKSLSLVLAALAALSLVACSGGSKSSSTTTTTTQSSPGAGASPGSSPSAGASAASSPAAAGASPAASPMAGSGAMSGRRPALNATPAPIPASLHCTGGQPPVWTNSTRHVYHVASDPFYGRTKHGSYMCLRDAVNAGYRAAGMGHHAGGAMRGAVTAPPSPAAT